jgi:hypothetical protein
MKKGPDPWAFTKTTHATKMHDIDVAGWGGGPGMTHGWGIRGLMTVDLHDSGLLHVICEEDCEAGEEWFAKRFHGHYKKDDTYWIPKGSRIYIHPKHIRGMTVAQPELAKKKETCGV